MVRGITASAGGFYGPQGRELRGKLKYPELNGKIEKFTYQGRRITNLEMETSALYGLSKLLGHKALTVCVAIANRVTKDFSKDYKPYVEELIKIVLERI
jgi:uridine phosphorylase